MSEQTSTKVAILFIILLGIVALIASAFLVSSFFAIVGFSLVFWGALLLYIIPTRSNFAILANEAAGVASANIEKILSTASGQKGIYIPQTWANSKVQAFKNIEKKNVEGVLVFIPKFSKISVDNISDYTLSSDDGVFLTPPGMGLYKVLENQLGRPFSKINLKQFISIMPSVLTKGSKFAESVNIKLEESTLTVNVLKNIFEPKHQENDKQKLTYSQVGCILSSALACALAMVIQKPVTIVAETHDKESKIAHMKFLFIL